MEIRDTMLPVLGPKGGKEEVQALQEVLRVDGGVKVLKLQSLKKSSLKWLVINML